MESELSTVALGLQPPWEVVGVRFDPDAGQIDLEVWFGKGARFAYPACGAAVQPVHDTKARRWRHLSFFQYSAYIKAKMPRVGCEGCGKTSQVPATRPMVAIAYVIAGSATCPSPLTPQDVVVGPEGGG